MPQCKEISNAIPLSVQSKNNPVNNKWAELEMGRNSVNPCTIDNKTISINSKKIPIL